MVEEEFTTGEVEFTCTTIELGKKCTVSQVDLEGRSPKAGQSLNCITVIVTILRFFLL
jgi:hypothetical protein